MPRLIFTLYSRSYCHLCDDMLVALKAILETHRQKVTYQIDVIDVDQDADLVDLYDELVPVLFVRKSVDGKSISSMQNVGEQLCHYFLDDQKVQGWCDE